MGPVITWVHMGKCSRGIDAWTDQRPLGEGMYGIVILGDQGLACSRIPHSYVPVFLSLSILV
jgi:hypothetical protein